MSHQSISSSNAYTPQGYKGMAAFHKYWGKKPLEMLTILIDQLTDPDQIILDPFLGYGLVAYEAILRKRRFIGIDINPIATDLARLLFHLPDIREMKQVYDDLSEKIAPLIHQSYRLDTDEIASHYLWDNDQLKQVWKSSHTNSRCRIELPPTPFDLELYKTYDQNTSPWFRPAQFFENSRINTSKQLQLSHLFTNRALYNMNLILNYASLQPLKIQSVIRHTLTAASGQMSKMVFAIGRRGKMKQRMPSTKTEVGSWVIGFWRPKLHFEINVWNCFRNKWNVLQNAIASREIVSLPVIGYDWQTVVEKNQSLSIILGNSKHLLRQLPNDCVSLVLTDPPHSDRIPYLELSEMWNAILGNQVEYQHEVVVSNAKDRGKTKLVYNKDMEDIMMQTIRILKPGGFIAIIYNARDVVSWQFLQDGLHRNPTIQYLGCMPLLYSANSVIQDSRKGSLKHDYILVYQKKGTANETILKKEQILRQIPQWSIEFPKTQPAGKYT